MTKKLPILFRRHRNPRVRYLVTPYTTANYMRVERRGTGSPATAVYNIKHIPEWMKLGMQLIDIAVSPDTPVTSIPGFGGKFKDMYVFYQEGGQELTGKE